MTDSPRKTVKSLLEPKSILFGLAVFNFILIWAEARNLAVSGIACVLCPWYHPWSYFNEPSRLLLAAGFLWLGRMWSNIASIILSGYMVVHFVYLVFVSNVTLAQEWRYLRKYEPYLVGSFDSPYILGALLFSFSIYYVWRQVLGSKSIGSHSG